MKRFFAAVALITTTLFSLTAQNEDDALRYSDLFYGGTARFNAMGGAFGALGADFSTLSTNPAGIGLYRSSEFTTTPTLFTATTESKYFDTKLSDTKYNFNFNNLGLVLTFEPLNRVDNGSAIKNLQFGVGLNRINNFHNRMEFEGYNPSNSLIDVWVDQAAGIPKENLNDDPSYYDLHMAWWTYLIDPLDTVQNTYTGAIPYNSGHTLQRYSMESQGLMNELALTFGGNLMNRLYFGASLGFPYLRYERISTFSESDVDNYHTNADPTFGFDHYDLYEELETYGSGVNFKFGLIYRITSWVRVGGAIHTPTFYYGLTDEWYAETTSRFDNGDEFTESVSGSFDYDLETPMRAMGSIAFVIGKMGLVSADYEFVDYSNATLRSDLYGFNDENQSIENKFRSVGNIRVGTEWRVLPVSLRAGYRLHPSPYESGINDAERHTFSFGLGYRESSYFIDLAYLRSMSSDKYYPYWSENFEVEPARNDRNTNTFMLTLGMKF